MRALTVLFGVAVAVAAPSCKPREAVAPGAGAVTPAAPEPNLLAADQPGPAAIAMDATDIYWNDWGRPIVRKMPRAGGPVTTLYTGQGAVGGRSIALDDDGVYFDETFDVLRVPKAGGPATKIGGYGSLPARLAGDRDGVYTVASGGVTAHPRAGGTITLAAESEPWDVAVDATHVYWVARGGVKRAPKAGGPVQVLALGQFRFARLTVTDTDVYWGDAVLGAIFSVPKGGGPVRYVAHDWNMASKDLKVAGGFVWAMQMGGQLDRIDPATGTTTTVAMMLERGGSADHYIAMAMAGDDVFVASGGESSRSGGLQVVDLTQPNAKLPEMVYGGEILRVSTRPPDKAIVSELRAAQIAMVWFDGATANVQDRGNAIRWITELEDAIVPDVRAGKLGLRLVAEQPPGLPEEIARRRARFVEDAIRGELGAKVRIETVLAPPRGYHGDVEVTVDTDDLVAAMRPRP